MASNPSKVGKPVRYKCLSSITLGGNEIRFVGINERNNGVYFPRSVNNCPGRPLFVAVDVMGSSKLSKKNYIRVITRFSKLGFAVKMRLSGFKIKGINNSSVIWFFSVQGLFRVAFDQANMAFQKDCLTQLQDIWLKRYEDPLLPPESVLHFNKQLTLMCHPKILVRQKEVRKSLSRIYSDKGIIGSDSQGERILLEDSNVADTLLQRESVHNCSQIDSNCSPGMSGCMCNQCDCGLVREETVPSENRGSVHVHDKMDISDQAESSMQCSETYCKSNFGCIGTVEFKERLKQFILSTSLEDISNTILQQILLVLEYLNYFSSSEKTEYFKNFGSVIFKFMEEFLALANHDSEMLDISESRFGLCQEKCIFLNLISDWLGHEYHDLGEALKENAESFKKENITCIDSLPSAETIIDTLFPSYMKTFVTNWLGFDREHIEEESLLKLRVLSDHCYNRTLNKERNGNMNYQLVQLILEFGSNCLISGIGHVVFSRLQIQNRSGVCL